LPGCETPVERPPNSTWRHTDQSTPQLLGACRGRGVAGQQTRLAAQRNNVDRELEHQ
jgi:hypothetical protein